MDELKSESIYKLSDFEPIKEDELALAKGCFSGLLMATPIWIIIIVILKWIL